MKLNLVYSTPGKSIYTKDKDLKIYCIDGNRYVDILGNPIEIDEAIKENRQKEETKDDDTFESEWLEYQGLEEKLIAESTVELEWEIDDVFGNFGFKNKAGEFVIEPQYAYAHEFTCGLAAVNLNRTWYKTEEGYRYYENHYGYIDHLGKTIIPFSFNEAYPFNKYGVAVVEYTSGRGRLIDTKGNFIPGTENLDVEHYYDYYDRYLEFVYDVDSKNNEYGDDLPAGIYDTKERKILLEPSIDSFIEFDEDEILVYLDDGEMGESDFHQYYINSKGEPKYKWLMGKGFSTVEVPNKSLISIVGVSKYSELEGDPSSCFMINGKKYGRTFLHGLYTADGEFLLPTEYKEITEIDENVFACLKDGMIYVYRVM